MQTKSRKTASGPDSLSCAASNVAPAHLIRAQLLRLALPCSVLILLLAPLPHNLGCSAVDEAPTSTGADASSGRSDGATICTALRCTRNLECGAAPDGCGAVVQCGACPAGTKCGGGGPNRCGTAPCTPVACQPLACGVVSDGCASVLDCGGCAAGTTCNLGKCEASGAGGSSGAGGTYPPGPPAALPGRSSGIWYSTWYTALDPYVWQTGHGQGASARMLADVDGDHLADAVAFFGSGELAGSWYVALSSGAGFDNYSLWRDGHGIGSSWQGLGDVDGDGKADAVVFFGDGSLGGSWYVALSNGAGFNTFSQWGAGHGTGSSWQGLGDVDGDGKADAVAFFGAGGLAGNWYVATSNGGGFNGYSQWTSGHGTGSSWQGLADVNGDQRADAVVFFGDGGLAGNWYVATSNGAGFNGYGQWASGHGAGSSWQGVADIDGDGSSDALAYFAQGGLAGKWYAALSSGGGFNGYFEWRGPRPTEGGQQPAFVGCADVTGDKTSDAVLAFPHGVWTVRRAEGNADMTLENLWIAWGIDYVPKVDGAIKAYDSGWEAVIDSHLAAIRAAGFDFILLDLTNNVQTGFILDRALKVRDRLSLFNAPRPPDDRLRLAVGVGGMQFSHDPATLEAEAKFVRDTFVSGDLYHNWHGKPLLVAYMETADRESWKQSPNHAETDSFSIGFMQGQVVGPDQAGFFGWGFQDTPAHPEVMGVMPGWNNNKGGPVVLRAQGAFFNQGWRKVIAQRPLLTIVNSFNEFAEETGVEPAVTSGVLGRPPTKEPWLDFHGAPTTDFYWQMTRQWNLLYRTGCVTAGSYVREVGKPDVFLWNGSSFEYQGTMPHDAPVLEIEPGTMTACPAK